MHPITDAESKPDSPTNAGDAIASSNGLQQQWQNMTFAEKVADIAENPLLKVAAYDASAAVIGGIGGYGIGYGVNYAGATLIDGAASSLIRTFCGPQYALGSGEWVGTVAREGAMFGLKRGAMIAAVGYGVYEAGSWAWNKIRS